jgi:serine protease Do
VGSGVAIGADEVLTTASVVLAAEKIVVVTDNKLQVDAVLVGLDPIHNVALLRVPGLELPALAFASRATELGDWVIALGSSYGAAPTQSVGNISYRWREPRLTLLQLTNQVYPGNSGGAALNSRGELIGLVQGELDSPRLASSEGDSDRRPGGVSFIIPLQEVRTVCDALRREGRVRLGWMGVSTRAGYVNSDTQPDVRVPLGAVVESAQPGGPADRAGLRPGDLIVAFDGERVEYPEQLARWVGAAARTADSEPRSRHTRAEIDRARGLQDSAR